MRIETSIPGTPGAIEIAPEQIYAFEPRLGGFEHLRRFARVTEPDSPIEWLQALEDPTVCFATIEPFALMPEYAFELTDTDVLELGVREPEDTLVRCLVTVREDVTETSANLLAPLVFSRRTHLARQVILQDSGMPLRFPLAAVLEAERRVSA